MKKHKILYLFSCDFVGFVANNFSTCETTLPKYFLTTARIGFRLGIHIRHRHWRQGYAFEAARAVIRYAFDSIKVSGLFAGRNPKNEGSRHLLAKLGFRYTHDEFYKPTGLNHLSYLMIADDYLKCSVTT
jgi:RimJ/RimL family protein N-acetyltransferase